MKRRRIVTLICIALVAAGILLLVAGSLPFERMQSYGALVRRADDFTPQRYARYRHVCWFFAIALPALAAVLWRRQRSATPNPDFTLAVSRANAETRLPGDRLLWLIVAVGLGLRLQRLFDPVAYDEAYTYLNFASRPWYEAIGDYNSTNNHLLNTLLMHVSTRIFGPQEWAMRWHVLLAGSVLPIAVYVWGKEWFGRGVGLIAAAAVAVSPMLITYSTDARGYIMVTLAAIVFDLSLGRLAGMHPEPGYDRSLPGEASDPELRASPSSIRPGDDDKAASAICVTESGGRTIDHKALWIAWAALVFGLCSMPLMVYAATGSAAWFVLSPMFGWLGMRAEGERIRTIAGIGLLAVPIVAAFYAPAYIFRGLMFLSDPIVRSADSTGFPASLGNAWKQAFEWWTAGAFPDWLWAFLALFACVVAAVMTPNAPSRLRWGLPFLVVLLFNIAQHVAPPPRIYMHLAPWVFVAAGLGVQWIAMKLRRRTAFKGAVPAVILLGIGWFYAFTRPVLFNERERADFQSVPDAIAAVEAAAKQFPVERHILLAPLPCDLPALFYLRRSGHELPVNERPQPGDRVYILTRPDETPQHVLATPLLNMGDLAPEFDAWLNIASFRTLTLYTSQIPAPEK